MRLFGVPLFPEQASSLAADVDALYFFLIAVSGFVCLLVVVAVFWFIVKYRRKSETEEPPKPIHGHLGLEIAWSVAPMLVFLVIFFWGAHLFIIQLDPPADAAEVYVVGKQWMWKVQHPEGKREINELHVPVGRKVKLWMTSEDVIHSFFIPAFRMKMDAVPGRYTATWFEATKTGVYHLFCAEYCGTEHSRMIGRVVVMEPAAYQQWLTSGPISPTVRDEGEALLEKYACITCHGTGRAPAFAGVFGSQVKLADGTTVTADEEYVRESILDPATKIVAGYDALMPSFRGQIKEDEIMKIISYLKKAGVPAGEVNE